MIRYVLHFYAYEEKKRNLKLGELKTDIEKPKHRKLEDVVEYYKSQIDEDVYKELKKDLEKVIIEIDTEAEEVAKRVSLVGSLSTAGITSLAYQHETKRQFSSLDDILKQLDKIIDVVKDEKIRSPLLKLKRELSIWLERMKKTNNLFAYLSDTENLEIRKRYSARAVIEDVRYQMEALSQGIVIDTSNIEYLLLPKASLVEWSSIFQNVYLNAFNALLDSEKKLIQVSSTIHGKEREILIQDTGVGVDLENSDDLFNPLVREIKISKERRALGYGGTGLGLTIVKLLAHNIGCEVSFQPPERGFKTAFSLKWSEN